MAASASLPFMHGCKLSGYGPPMYGQSHAFSINPGNATCPSAPDSYSPPSSQQRKPGGDLLPLQKSEDRFAGYPSPEQYITVERSASAYPQDQYQHSAPHYERQQPRSPPEPHIASSYAVPQAPCPCAHTQRGAIPVAHPVPRQRVSVACKYCRKRKVDTSHPSLAFADFLQIRCSGYQSTPGGSCKNCARLDQVCVFQPVSWPVSSALIPISATSGNVPSSTPLHCANLKSPEPQNDTYNTHGSRLQQPDQQPPPHQGLPGHQPQVTHKHQVPPGQSSAEEERQEQSPTTTTGSRPGSQGLLPLPTQQSAGVLTLPALPQLHHFATKNEGEPDHGGRSPAQAKAPDGVPTISHQSQPPSQAQKLHLAQQPGQQHQQREQDTAVMSWRSLMATSNRDRDIDKSMLDRLNKPKNPPPLQ